MKSDVMKAWESCDLTDTVSLFLDIGPDSESKIFIRIQELLFTVILLTTAALRLNLHRLLLAHYPGRRSRLQWLFPPPQWHGIFYALPPRDLLLYNPMVCSWLFSRLLRWLGRHWGLHICVSSRGVG